MKLLADENFPLHEVGFLKSLGYDIKSIALEHESSGDEEVLRLAMMEARIILTFDRDYRELVFHQNIRPPQGVIYLRLPLQKVSQAGVYVHELLSRPGFDTRHQLTVFDGVFMR